MSDKKSKTPKKKQESAPTRTMARPGTVEGKANKSPPIKKRWSEDSPPPYDSGDEDGKDIRGLDDSPVDDIPADEEDPADEDDPPDGDEPTAKDDENQQEMEGEDRDDGSEDEEDLEIRMMSSRYNPALTTRILNEGGRPKMNQLAIHELTVGHKRPGARSVEGKTSEKLEKATQKKLF